MNLPKMVFKQSFFLTIPHNWWILFFVTLIIKCLLSHFVPLTGDEAYFAIWGRFLDWGYYDHTPLIGWILYPLTHIGSANLILRLPTILASSLIGYGLYWFLYDYDAEKAFYISCLYLISPFNLLGIIVTTDTPLIFFSFLSAIFLSLAIKKKDHWIYYFASGIGLGLAFFSKYFAVLLALSYGIYFLYLPKNKQRTIGFFILFASVLPFGIINLYWNYYHAWANLLFNLYNRNRNALIQGKTVIKYLLTLLYLGTPPILYYLVRPFKERKRTIPIELQLFFFTILIPCSFFLILSVIKSIGLHWILSFVPFFYILLIYFLSIPHLQSCLKGMAIWSSLHIVVLILVMTLPMPIYSTLGLKGSSYANWVFDLKHREILQKLIPYQSNFILSSDSYAKANLLYVDNNYTTYYPFFGLGSEHGRQDDLLVDFKSYQNKNFAILLTHTPDLSEFKPYFRSIQIKQFYVENALYYVVLGYHFNYPVYRNTILKTIYERYWTVPKGWPLKENFYWNKYFLENHTAKQTALFR